MVNNMVINSSGKLWSTHDVQFALTCASGLWIMWSQAFRLHCYTRSIIPMSTWTCRNNSYLEETKPSLNPMYPSRYHSYTLLLFRGKFLKIVYELLSPSSLPILLRTDLSFYPLYLAEVALVEITVTSTLPNSMANSSSSSFLFDTFTPCFLEVFL